VSVLPSQPPSGPARRGQGAEPDRVTLVHVDGRARTNCPASSVTELARARQAARGGRIPPVHSDRHRPARHRSRVRGRAHVSSSSAPSNGPADLGSGISTHRCRRLSYPSGWRHLARDADGGGLTGSTGSTGGALGVGTSSGRIPRRRRPSGGPVRIDTGLLAARAWEESSCHGTEVTMTPG